LHSGWNPANMLRQAFQVRRYPLDLLVKVHQIRCLDSSRSFKVLTLARQRLEETAHCHGGFFVQALLLEPLRQLLDAIQCQLQSRNRVRVISSQPAASK